MTFTFTHQVQFRDGTETLPFRATRYWKTERGALRAAERHAQVLAMSLYRCFYSWPDGMRASVTFAARPSHALAWAGRHCAALRAELLGIKEVRPLRPAPMQFTLEG